MAKTYVGSLRFVVGGAHKYATRYQAQLSSGLTTAQYAALLAFIACCAELLSALGPKPVSP